MADAAGELERGRRSYAASAWTAAREALAAADAEAGLGATDLELLATAAYMLGRQDEYLEALERACRARLDAGEALAAVRNAFWVGVTLATSGKMGRAGGWLGRARRILDGVEGDHVEEGYLLLPLVFENEARGDLVAAASTAGRAAAVGQRFGDPDLFALAAHEEGHVLIRLGRVREGLTLLDESMVAVTAGELSPIASGIVYCGVVLACQEAHELRRAQEWTAALSSWCERQPDVVAFTGRCLVHRAEILQLHGDWPKALEEAERAVDRCLRGENPAAAGEACYRRGEVHRLRAEFRQAGEAYREATSYGREPQPGLALMRLAQGKVDSAGAAVRRLESEIEEPPRRAGLLPAYVEIMLAVDDRDAARRACAELEAIARHHESAMLDALAAQARGAVELAAGDARAALGSLRRAFEGWQDLEAPYEVARARELHGLACREAGDVDAAGLQLEAARDAFDRLGAASDLARVATLAEIAAAGAPHGLTGRELEVLRHLAAGETNKDIAAALVLSVRTVDRHVSNIYAKLGVSSRAAATAFAHEHGLL